MGADDTNYLVSRTVTFKRWTFSLREVVLIVLVLVGLFLCLLFAGLFGGRSSELSSVSSQLSSVQQSECKTPMCFETSAYAIGFLNQSANPCDNFYKYACGGYNLLRTLDTGREVEVDVIKEMRKKNEAQLRALLVSGRFPEDLNTSSAERKLKLFYTSCTDDYTTELLKGTPFVEAVKTRGLLNYLIDPNFKQDKWDFNHTLEQVQVDMWVDALFAPRVRIDQTDSKKRIIAIYPGGTHWFMSWSDYTDHPTAQQQKHQNNYKKFIRTLATLITRDAGVSSDQSLSNRIDVFVGDVFDVESRIAKYASNTRYQGDAFTHEKTVTIADLTLRTGGVIDWKGQMSYMFNENTITDSTKVAEPYPTYLSNMTAMIQQLDQSNRNRKLHNYLTFRTLDASATHLSWEYIHAIRQFYMDKFNYKNFVGIKNFCFYVSEYYFNIALNALYVNAQFDMKNKAKITDITESVKTSLENTITANTWMDKATKDYAISKMRGSTYKIGYPDFMTDEAKVDAYYTKLTINVSDYFGNIMGCNMEDRRLWNKYLREGEDRSDWYFNTYDVNIAVLWDWDEIIVPAGLLQVPIYEYSMPHYYSFGAIGTLLGHYIHHLIDEYGRFWNKGGDYMETPTGWWSNQTWQNYEVSRQCVVNVYDNITQGPYFVYNGQQQTVDVNGQQYAGEAMAVTTGIRLAYNAYQSWQQKYGVDNYSPGLHLSPTQLFFIGHAQTYCKNRHPVLDYFYASIRNVDEETMVNVALMELPEFQQAFQCQASDNMVPKQRCTYY